MPRFHSIGKYTWKCPLPQCDAKSKKEVSHTKARTYGRRHIILYHPKLRYSIEPVLKRTK